MPTERMEEVEVLCSEYEEGETGLVWCPVCESRGPGCKTVTATVAPHSLTAARLRLADAAEKWDIASRANPSGSEPAWIAYVEALAALRTARGEG